jgi:3',5'-cyclic-AMP phosphodiesterase
MGYSNAASTGVDRRVRRPRYTIAQVSDLHVPPAGFLLERFDACARVKACFEMIVAAGCFPHLLVLFDDVADQAAVGPNVRGNRGDAALEPAHPLGHEPGRRPLNVVVRAGGLRLIGMDSSVPGKVHGELNDAQLDALANELAEPAADGTVLVVDLPPMWSPIPPSDHVALREPERLAAVIRGSDVQLVLSGHAHRSVGTLAGVPAWGSPSSASLADAPHRNGFGAHAGGGFTRIDILGDGDIVARLVPLRRGGEIVRAFLVADRSLPPPSRARTEPERGEARAGSSSP